MSWISSAIGTLGKVAGGLGGLGVLGGPAGAIMTGIGLLDTLNKQRVGNSRAAELERQAMGNSKEAYKQQQEMTGFSADAFRRMMEIAQNADKNGTFDADKRIAFYKDQFGQQLAHHAGQSASAWAQMGYRPGDSMPKQDIFGLQGNYANRFAQAAEQARLEQPGLTIGAYNSANPGAMGALGGQLAGSAQNMNAMLLGQAGAYRQGADGSSFLGALYPFLEGGAGQQTQSSGGMAGKPNGPARSTPPFVKPSGRLAASGLGNTELPGAQIQDTTAISRGVKKFKAMNPMAYA